MREGGGAMPARPRCKKVVILAALALLLGGLFVVQCLTYMTRAVRTAPLAGIRAELEGVPEREYFVVWEDTWESLTAPQREALEEWLGRNGADVYHSMDEVPERHKHFADRVGPDGERELLGIDSGLALGWDLSSHGPFWMRCDTSCWVGNLGGSGQGGLYVWILGRWVLVLPSGRWVS